MRSIGLMIGGLLLLLGVIGLIAQDYLPGALLVLAGTILIGRFRPKVPTQMRSPQEGAPAVSAAKVEAGTDVPVTPRPHPEDTPGSTASDPLRMAREIVETHEDNTQIARRELAARLLGTNWEWADFDKWNTRFRKLGYYPPMWAGVQIPPDVQPEEAAALLREFRQLPLDARRLLIANYALTRESTGALEDLGRRIGLTEKQTREVVAVLAEHGFAQYPLSISETLMTLTVNELKEICDEFGVPKTGRKAELVARLVDSTPTEALTGLLPSAARRDGASLGRSATLRVKNVIDWEMSKIDLLEHTFRMERYTEQNIRSARSAGFAKAQIHGTPDDPCPICNPLNDKVVDLRRLSGLPPFHPGCRCSIGLHL